MSAGRKKEAENESAVIEIKDKARAERGAGDKCTCNIQTHPAAAPPLQQPRGSFNFLCRRVYGIVALYAEHINGPPRAPTPAPFFSFAPAQPFNCRSYGRAWKIFISCGGSLVLFFLFFFFHSEGGVFRVYGLIRRIVCFKWNSYDECVLISRVRENGDDIYFCSATEGFY